MVLINCGKSCLHQKDGLCTLEASAGVTGKSIDGCCYYSPKVSENSDMPAGSSFEGPPSRTI